MKQILTVFLALGLMVGCSDERTTKAVVTANDGLNGLSGLDGVDGKNGHSIVTKVTEASECECETSGSRIDMFVDLNDNLDEKIKK